MALKIYQKFGLRRDNDLGDLNNQTLALTNVLDNIQSGTEFKAEDLLVIKGMYSQGLESGTFLQVGGSAEESTNSDGVTSPLTPYISYQNRLDLSETYAGTPRIYGGDGPNVKYYDFDQVAEPLPTDPTINTGMWVSGTEPFAQDQFWERGQFGWDRKLHEKSSSVNGGIEWEGYYVPTGTGLHNFTVGTTGCWTFDFQKVDYTNAFQPNTDWDTAPGGAYNAQRSDTHSTIYKNYAFIRPEVNISCYRYVAPDNSTGTVLQIVNPADYNKVAAGMTCINGSYIEGGNDGAKVSEYDTTNGRVTLDTTLVDGSTNNSPVKNALSNGSSGAQDIKFVQETNQSTSANWRIEYPLTKGTPYRIKFRYFTPQIWDSNKSNRFMNMVETIPNGGSQSQLNYRKLYSLTYDFSEKAKGSFNKFLDASILFGGGTTGGTTHANYTTIKTTKKIDGRYDPINLTLTNDYDSTTVNGKKYPYKKIEIWTGTKVVAQSSSSISIDNTTGIEVGNYIYDHSWATSGAPGGETIDANFQNNGDLLVTGNGSATLTFAFSYNDAPGDGYALGTYSLPQLSVSFTQDTSSQGGSNSATVNSVVAGNYAATISNANAAGFTVESSGKKLCFKDGSGSDCNAEVVVTVTGGTETKYIADGTRIVEVIPNSSIILSSPFLATGSPTLKIIEHRGHIKRFVADHNNSKTLTLKANTPTGNNDPNKDDELKKKMIVVGEHLPINTQIDVRPTTATTVEVTASTTGGNLTNKPYYVYDYQGLINDSMLAFCEPSAAPDQNICLTVEGDIPEGSTSITFSSAGVSQAAWNSIPNNNNRVLGYYFASGTTASKSGSRTLNLSTPTVKLIKEGNNFTVSATPNSTEDKSLCCPPKDTAPPFASTDDGMVTLDDFETLDVLSGNVIFDNIRATILPSTEIVEPPSVTYDGLLGTLLDKRIKFKAGDGNTYRLFVSTT